MRKLLATMLAGVTMLALGACSSEAANEDPKLHDDDAALTEGAVDEQLQSESGAGVQGEVESPSE